MAGNSQRRSTGPKGKRPTVGSGGRGRKALKGRGPTPKAEDRVYHKAYKAKQERLARTAARRPAKPKGVGPEWVIGRNPVLEALHAGLPVRTAYVAEGAEHDSRLREILTFAADHGIALMQATRGELDRITGGSNHQGVALRLPEYQYATVDDLIAAGPQTYRGGLVVALDKVTDPRNLGAIIRSAAAFGAQGVLIPSRRSASMTAAAWKTSAGAAARIPVAMATNLNQALSKFAAAGWMIVGLAGEAELDFASAPGLDGPLVIVVGSEGEGLARLTRQSCDVLASIPISSDVESLNASVAASIALYEAAKRRTGSPSS
ncbi:23S rRNA (guanosine(2251)-2'-O)-methyltransferase RlmB [Cutibacterium sp. WCA-380-WT-3A]|uniref:23S rRNA (Guanosine(2251)-2'-O)-methyltransferase RlmB n=1 Tax=Cutibacterium porci TaxID=2605781 RepID=A0A7K0J567_9ACTN|nr:23S rRNA (guanosine(2251)-2'-O)-methyltransferase RlmB [Cutibacterium porci]MSS45063.1 23S rRNA (guanosine(2251)-2'-O)-methyltransferase RlmB [Cutibacterium porci]